jgi:MSHA biogenesis protein MshO
LFVHVLRARGHTLLELVAVILLLGIIAAVAGLVLRDPIRAYDDARKRAELTDAAETALRRIATDLRLALPNSIRLKQGGTSTFVEFLQVRTGGRYRSAADTSGNGDFLDFAATDTAFDTLGPLSTLTGQAIQANDALVIFNLNAGPSVTESNAYTFNQAASNCTSATPSSSTCNSARITGPDTAGTLAGERHIAFDARKFPYTSPGNRFHVVSGPVTFQCDPTAGTLDRVSGYTTQLTQPGPVFPGTPVTGRLADFISACDIQYDPVSSLPTYTGLLTIRLTLTRNNETVTLYQEVHVSNVP